MFRKITAILLTIAMLFSICLCACAEENGQPPEPPSGDMAPPDGGNGQPPERPDGNPPDGGPGGGGFGGGTPPGGGTSDFTYTAVTEITETAEQAEQTYQSETADESALIINTGDAVTISNPTVIKTGDSNGGDNCNFYGLNAGVLAMGGTTTNITGGIIETSASGANGVFSYGGNGGRNGAEGDGTTVNISDTIITTTGDGSGGIMTTGGGTTNATNLTITTSGRSSAAIRTDRGGGLVTVDGGSYTTNGLGSPAIYSTADIEGKNTITLENCNMTANNTQCNGNATFHDTIMIYQSMSGDADSGTSSFTMTGGSLTSQSGHMFHVTNTHAVINLSGAQLINEGSDILLSVCDDGWNGASNIAEVNADGQEMEGVILVGDNSSLNLTLTNGSSFTGYFSGEIENAKGETVSTEIGTVNVNLDESSTWTLTADSYITSFEGNAANVTGNGYTLYVNGVALEGIN